MNIGFRKNRKGGRMKKKEKGNDEFRFDGKQSTLFLRVIIKLRRRRKSIPEKRIEKVNSRKEG